jgi:DNA-directed RNA polymerase specialized sigma24 family protein
MEARHRVKQLPLLGQYTIAIVYEDAASATFCEDFAWISSFTGAFFFCRLIVIHSSVRRWKGGEMHPIAEHGELVEPAQKCGVSEPRREEVVSLLAKLPLTSKKVLAMYYHENMRLLDIATCLGVTESEIREIHAQAVESIHLLMVK